MVSLFGLWIETRARLAGRGPALPQKGGATAGNAPTQREGEQRVARLPQGCSNLALQVARLSAIGVEMAQRETLGPRWLSVGAF